MKSVFAITVCILHTMQNCIQKCNIRLEKREIYIEVFNIVLKTLWNIKNCIPPKLSIQFSHIHNLLYNL